MKFEFFEEFFATKAYTNLSEGSSQSDKLPKKLTTSRGLPLAVFLFGFWEFKVATEESTGSCNMFQTSMFFKIFRAK